MGMVVFRSVLMCTRQVECNDQIQNVCNKCMTGNFYLFNQMNSSFKKKLKTLHFTCNNIFILLDVNVYVHLYQICSINVNRIRPTTGF